MARVSLAAVLDLQVLAQHGILRPVFGKRMDRMNSDRNKKRRKDEEQLSLWKGGKNNNTDSRKL